MALPPTVPSSFVPYSGTNTRRYRRADFGGAFAFLAYGVFFLMVAAAVGVFIYGRILATQKKADDVALAKAEGQLDPKTVNDFVRLQDRLKLGGSLLDKHVALSNFFTTLNATIPKTVRLKSLSLSADVKQDGGYALTSTGDAASLNALAQFSNDLGSGKKIKNVIVSNIKVNQKDNSVSFSLSADLDPSLVAFSAATAAVPLNSVQSQTAATSTSLTATTTKP